MDKLRDENKALREATNKTSCPSCGTATSSKDAGVTSEEQQLRIENARLKSEVTITRLLHTLIVKLIGILMNVS